jgi:dihydroxyacetone kinase
MIVGRACLTRPAPATSSRAAVEFVTETSAAGHARGVLYIVNNYTGDRTAWEMAKEIQEAEGQKIGWLLVNDDVAVKDSTWTVGRRGVAGNFFVIKAAAAMADKGGSLEECVRVGEKVIGQVRTMGIALTSCTPPVRGTPLFEIADDEMEVGIGIHGEPGRQRTKIVSANEIVDLLLNAIVPDLPFVRRRGRGHGQRPGRDPHHGALPPLRHRPQEAGREGHQGLPQLRRRVLHVARDGRRAHLAPQGGRRAEEAAPRPGRDRVPVF